LEAQNCTEGIFSFLYLNVRIGFARKFVKNESKHFVDCRRKNLSSADYRGAKREKFIRWTSHMLMYDKTCGKDR